MLYIWGMVNIDKFDNSINWNEIPEVGDTVIRCNNRVRAFGVVEEDKSEGEVLEVMRYVALDSNGMELGICLVQFSDKEPVLLATSQIQIKHG